jgi:hypothetical protein
MFWVERICRIFDTKRVEDENHSLRMSCKTPTLDHNFKIFVTILTSYGPFNSSKTIVI